MSSSGQRTQTAREARALARAYAEIAAFSAALGAADVADRMTARAAAADRLAGRARATGAFVPGSVAQTVAVGLFDAGFPGDAADLLATARAVAA